MCNHVTCRNGPIGSAVCVFSFDYKNNDIVRVFQGDYLTLSSSSLDNVWTRSTNSQPINVRNLVSSSNIYHTLPFLSVHEVVAY